MQVLNQDGAWWVLAPEETYGPYETRREAEEDRRGLARFKKYCDEPGFVTMEDTDASLSAQSRPKDRHSY